MSERQLIPFDSVEEIAEVAARLRACRGRIATYEGAIVRVLETDLGRGIAPTCTIAVTFGDEPALGLPPRSCWTACAPGFSSCTS